MKKRILLVFIICISSTIYCSAQQTNLPDRQAGLDSLYTVWQDQSQPDSSRVQAYNDYIWYGYLFSQPDTAELMAEALHAYAKKHSNPKASANAYKLQGVANAVQGKYNRALEYYEKSKAINEELGDKKAIAGILGNIGLIYSDQSDYPRALEYYEKSLAIQVEIGNKKDIANSLNNFGLIYYKQSDYTRALNYYEKCLAIREEIGDKNGIANSLISIGMAYQFLGDYPHALEHYEKSLATYEELRLPDGQAENKPGIANSLNNIGAIYNEQGNYPRALDYYLKGLAIREEIGDKKGIAVSLSNIGRIYSDQDDYPRALDYYEKCLTISKEIGNKMGIAISLNNIGAIYNEQGNYTLGLEYHQKSLAIYEEIGDKRGIALSLGNIGEIYGNQGNYPRALEYFEKSLALYEEIGDKLSISASLNYIGLHYQKEGKYTLALSYCQKGLALAEEVGTLEWQKNSCECLYDTYKSLGKGNDALVYLEKMKVIEDSLHAGETTKKLEQMEFAKVMLQDSITKAEEARLVLEAHQEEVRQKNKTRNALLGGGAFVLLLAGGLFARNRYITRSKATLQIEKDRSENLLLNILPEEIAQELKIYGKAEARDFDLVSILFTDFKEFTQASEKLTAQELVGEINTCFEAFDSIMAKHKIEKIKTIGDAYMAAGGLPIPTEDSVKNTVLAALEMQSFISNRKNENDEIGKPAFEMRVGIHTGPVVAGIVGVKKFQYDIWGDTVNTASRIESNGEAGKVNVSESTYEILRDDHDFTFENRGKIEVKGKGPLEMYFVSRKK